MKVLVIFDLIPEETKKAIVDMTQEEYDYFKQGDGCIIGTMGNTDEQEVIVNVINNAFCEDEKCKEYCENDQELKYFGKFEHQENTSDLRGVDYMIYCGCFL